jgi:hypothetical protein
VEFNPGPLYISPGLDRPVLIHSPAPVFISGPGEVCVGYLANPTIKVSSPMKLAAKVGDLSFAGLQAGSSGKYDSGSAPPDLGVAA